MGVIFKAVVPDKCQDSTKKCVFFGWNWIIVQVILAIKAWICGFWTAHGTCQSGVVWLDVDFELVFQAMPYARPTCQHQARRKNDSRMKDRLRGLKSNQGRLPPCKPNMGCQCKRCAQCRKVLCASWHQEKNASGKTRMEISWNQTCARSTKEALERNRVLEI